ncbi:VOC family protein [Nocardioides sp. BP30]|uniref:VOC family protein n=1 Tax=Nocardioides sp. BP30 TaxID=3036374 RepID=UPI0024691252|nr:VOC family protein [Nocardioides sp. BP30]WGL53617.1 VOC family protein [Nocardioides sp. BP30]
MDQRISFVTLAVGDVARTHAFYVGGLGWVPSTYVEGEVLMIQVGPRLMLSLWDRAAFEAEVGPIASGDGVPPITLAHNVATREEVDGILLRAEEIGAGPLSGGQERDWGGYTGYFADPDGYRWEIAYNPGPIGEVVLP